MEQLPRGLGRGDQQGQAIDFRYPHPILLPQGTLSSRGPSPPEDPLSPGGDSPCTPGHPLLQRTFSRLAAIHLVLLRNSPCLACRRFTLSRREKGFSFSATGDSLCSASSKAPTFGRLPSLSACLKDVTGFNYNLTGEQWFFYISLFVSVDLQWLS